MARRKKEPIAVHRAAIACAAQTLFSQKGIAATTMDEIAKEAGYSKATLYVYFKNKEEIIGVLVLRSMTTLYEHIGTAVVSCADTKSQYLALCDALVRYHEQFPFYFAIALDEIQLPLEDTETSSAAQETFAVGEKINRAVANMLETGVKNQSLRQDIPILPTIFLFWGSLSGVIQMAAKKTAYLENFIGLTKQAFLAQSFDALYRSIQNNSIHPS